MSNFLSELHLNNDVIVLLKDKAAQQSITALTTSLNNEVTARTDADTALQNIIDGEVTARTDADTTLQNGITALSTKFTNLYIINVKDYGATGDGVTDDTEAIKDAVDVLNVKGGVLYFPAGRYVIRETLNITAVGSTVQGESQQSVYVLQKEDTTAFHFGNGSTPTQAFAVKDISIVAQSTSISSTTCGIFFDYAVNSYINNVIVSDFYRGIMFTHAGNTFCANTGVVTSRENGIGFDIGDHSVSTSFTNIYVGFNGLATDTGIGFLANRGNIADVNIDYIDVGAGSVGVLFDGQYSPAQFPPADIRLKNIVVDASRVACIQISNINARGNVFIDGGWLNPQATSGNYCIKFDNVNNLHVRNVTMQQLADDDPVLIGLSGGVATNVSVIGCEFINLYSPVSVASSDRVMINNNTFTLYTDKSSVSNMISADGVYNIVINGNNMHGEYGNGIYINNGDYSVITGNMLRGITTAITNNQTNKVVDNNLS